MDLLLEISKKETLDYIDAFNTKVAFIPQVIKICKTKSIKDISLSMFVIFSFGIFC